MTKREMIEVIGKEAHTLFNRYQEAKALFGRNDEHTVRCRTRWYSVDKLCKQLNIMY